MTAPRDTPLTRFLATQTADQLRAIRSEFRAEIDSTREKLVELEEDLAVVEDAIVAKSGGRGAVRGRAGARNGAARTPTLRKTVLEFVGQRPGGWTRQEIMDELARREAAPTSQNPTNTLITRLGEMVNRGELEKFGELYRVGDKAAASKGAAQGSLPVGPDREQ